MPYDHDSCYLYNPNPPFSHMQNRNSILLGSCENQISSQYLACKMGTKPIVSEPQDKCKANNKMGTERLGRRNVHKYWRILGSCNLQNRGNNCLHNAKYFET